MHRCMQCNLNAILLSFPPSASLFFSLVHFLMYIQSCFINIHRPSGMIQILSNGREKRMKIPRGEKLSEEACT